MESSTGRSSAARELECLLAPRTPVDRIARVLQQVRAGLAGQLVAGSLTPTPRGRARRPTRCRRCPRGRPRRGSGPRVTPPAASAASSRRRCVVEAGWITSVFASPTLARCEQQLAGLDEAPRPPRGRPRCRRPGSRPARAAGSAARARGVRRAGLVGVADEAHARVRAQERGQRARVRDVPLHAQRQRLEALQEQEGVERREHRPEVAHRLDARLHDEREVAERLVRSACRGSRARAR